MAVHILLMFYVYQMISSLIFLKKKKLLPASEALFINNLTINFDLKRKVTTVSLVTKILTRMLEC